MPPSNIYRLLGVSTPFDPSNRYTTSIILPPVALALFRLLLSLYAFVTIFFILAWESTHGRSERARHWFSYFTNLTYFGLAFYFLFAGSHTLSYALRGKSWLNGWPRPLQAAHAIFYTTVVVFPPLVTIVYWVVLYKSWFKTDEQAWSNISQHGLNSLYALVEIIITRTNPPQLLHLPILIFILALYLSLAYLSRATAGFYVYTFLDPSNRSGKTAGYCFGILAGALVIYGIVWGLIWSRGCLARRFGLDYDRGEKRRRVRSSTEEEELNVVEMSEQGK